MSTTSTERMMEELRNQAVETWFDLGLMLDQLRDSKDTPGMVFDGDYEAFSRLVSEGIGFVTFYYAVDGVTVEIVKYAEAMRRVLPNPKCHFIGGHFDVRAEALLGPENERHLLKGINGFDAWPLYGDLFRRKLERGSALYNSLIRKLWGDVLDIAERLGRLVESKKIRLLYVVNVNSNPGNVALALAVVLVSEYLKIPVISNNHDFYWEGGHSRFEREARALPAGPRDHFFTNAHLGEVFSVLELIYPWLSRTWIAANISRHQSTELVTRFGHNPANVIELGTAVDTQRFAPLSRPRRVEVLKQISSLLAGSRATLGAKSVQRVIRDGLMAEERVAPMLIGAKDHRTVDFIHDNIILLQPTRIIARKKIETNFEVIARLFADEEIATAFAATPSLKLTLVVTGPIASGHHRYFERLLRGFDRLGPRLPKRFRDRVFFAPLLSGIDDLEFRGRFDKPCEISDLYGIATLVMLPSETEGRGLPIIESAACGVPIMARRYEPEIVFAAVVGEHLASAERFDVISYRGSRIGKGVITAIKQRILHPQRFRRVNVNNREVAQERFSMGKLASDFEACMRQLHRQLRANDEALLTASDALTRFHARVHDRSNALSSVLNTDHREYLPGSGRMAFMLMLKSLIDPSYYRVEEQRLRGMAFAFAQRLVDENPDPMPLSGAQLHEFFNCVDNLFLVRDGEMPIMFDHAFAYRHRHRWRMPHRDLTPHELTGVINLLFAKIAAPPAAVGPTREAAQHFSSWDLVLEQGCGGQLAIDNRSRLWQRLGENVPVAFFPGKALQMELELFVVQPIRARLGLKMDDALTPRHLKRKKLAPIYIFKRAEPLGRYTTADTLKAYIFNSLNEELKHLFHSGVCRIVPTNQISVGIDVRQLGGRAIAALREVREGGGFMVAPAEHAAMTTDVLDLERFHVGRVEDELTANVMDLQPGDGFVQWVPAGLRSTLAYPTPVQTARSLDETLRGSRFVALCKKQGERKVLDKLREDAEVRGTPVDALLEKLAAPRTGSASGSRVEREAINGLYADGLPWSGAMARVRSDKPRMRYRILSANDGPQTVLAFVKRFNRRSKAKARVAWNGGYILNAELVGKLGLPESYIGSPLGLIVSGGVVLCPPLFNKPAFLVGEDGSLAIRRVSCAGGLSIRAAGTRVDFGPDAHNPLEAGSAPCFYDLLFEGDRLPADGRTLVRLAGATIMEVARSRRGETLPVVPVGLCLSFPADELPSGWTEGTKLELEIPHLSGIAQAVEAGPLLLHGGSRCIDMGVEGWTSSNSIRTQAARLDYLDMRGPKIAIGLDGGGSLVVLTVNGRIRESVGATHLDMADILEARGIQTAMGFDPGGSSTLVVGTETANISPYNRDYERNVYALPPEPRAVANVVVGY